MNKWASWELFVVAIGLLVIVSSTMYDKPLIIVIEGLVIVLIGVILMKNKQRKENQKNNKQYRRK